MRRMREKDSKMDLIKIQTEKYDKKLRCIIFRAQLFKTTDVVSKCIVKTLIIKYGINANIFAEKIWVAFAFAKATHIFSAKIPVN